MIWTLPSDWQDVRWVFFPLIITCLFSVFSKNNLLVNKLFSVFVQTDGSWRPESSHAHTHSAGTICPSAGATRSCWIVCLQDTLVPDWRSEFRTKPPIIRRHSSDWSESLEPGCAPEFLSHFCVHEWPLNDIVCSEVEAEVTANSGTLSALCSLALWWTFEWAPQSSQWPSDSFWSVSTRFSCSFTGPQVLREPPWEPHLSMNKLWPVQPSNDCKCTGTAQCLY